MRTVPLQKHGFCTVRNNHIPDVSHKYLDVCPSRSEGSRLEIQELARINFAQMRKKKGLVLDKLVDSLLRSPGKLSPNQCYHYRLKTRFAL